MNHTAELIAEHHRDYTGTKLGMWLFLFTEILLFTGLFLLYSVFRSRYALDFHTASGELQRTLGTLNTLILLTSSLTMALSISAIQKGHRNISLTALGSTILLAAGFLVVKYFEWGAKIHHGIYPNSPALLEKSPGEILFFGLYYVITGMHGLHVLIGIFVLSYMWLLVSLGKINQKDFVYLENSGLYWHLVDIIWIFIFPLFYLIT
ncbi:MAG: cytochrome c oxidase subunit 3 family protein [bacterium JZ-2024 1]